MKKIIIPIMLILMMSLAYAQISPLPINGRIIGLENTGGLTVRVTNMRSLVSMNDVVNPSGEYLIEWANSPGSLKYNVTDVFKVEIVDCISDSKCTQTITYTGQPELFLIFDLFDVEISTTTSTTTTLPYCEGCPTCPSSDCDTCCPNCPTVTTITCPSCPTTTTCPTTGCDTCCPETPVWYSTLQFFIGLIIAFGGGIGVKIGLDKYGNPSIKITQHKHANYPTYHSIYTIHTKEPHKKGEIVPKYVDGKYVPT